MDLKYEQIANFCYYCGRVEHSDRLCSSRGEDLRRNGLKESQYGECLKGSRRSDDKVGERKYTTNMNRSRGEKEKGARREGEAEHSRENLGALVQKGRRECIQFEKGVRK